MKKITAAICLVLVTGASQAQFKNLVKKVKNAATNKAEDKTVNAAENSVDKGINSVLKKKNSTVNTTEPTEENPDNNSGSGTGNETSNPKAASITSYSKFDFVPGEHTLYAENFSQDAIGEFPVSWNSSGKGEVMTIDKMDGKWLRGYQNNTILSGNTKRFGENYTIEFDLIYFFNAQQPNYSFPDIHFGMFSSGDLTSTDNSLLRNHNSKNCMLVYIHPNTTSTATAESYVSYRQTFKSDYVKIADFYGALNKVHHYSIQVQKTRFRFWLNEKKLFDIPRAINTTDTLNQLFFKMSGSSYPDEQIGYYLSNIKIASGIPDTRHKLVEEGKFSTTGILFNVNSAVIQPVSYGVMKEIGTVLKENAGLKINIIGHTSSDGNPKANLELSKQRAAAVKAFLIKDFGIEEDRLTTDGKGDTKPAADNKTQEGRIQNRRVEFIKL